MKQLKRTLLTLVALIGLTTGAWADGTTTGGTEIKLTQGTGDKANEWTIDGGMPAGNVTFIIDYDDPLVTLTASDATKGSVHISKYNYKCIAEFSTTNTTDANGNYKFYTNTVVMDNGYYINTSDVNDGYLEVTQNSQFAVDNTGYAIFYGPNNESHRVDYTGGFMYIYIKNGKTYSDNSYTNELWEGGVKRVEVYALTYGLPDGVTDNGDGTYSVKEGTTITIEAEPAKHNYFTGWTGTNETDTKFTVTVGEQDLTYTANFAACFVLTIKSNDMTMGGVSIGLVDGESMIYDLDPANLYGQNVQTYMPTGFTYEESASILGATEWNNAGTDVQSILIRGEMSHIDIYGQSDKYSVVPQKASSSARQTTNRAAARRSSDYRQIVIYFKNGNTYIDANCTQMLWQGGVKHIEIYTEGQALPAGVEEISFDDGTYSVVPGTTLTLLARPEENYHLDSWSNQTSGSATLNNSITMDEDLKVIAYFMRNGYGLVVPNGRFATFCAAENIKLDPEPAAAEATGLYTITGIQDDRSKAQLTKLSGVVLAGTPMLVYNGTGGDLTMKLVPTNEDANPSNPTAIPEFKGTTNPYGETFDESDLTTKDYYTLSGGKVFAKALNPGTIGVNKCWLEIDKGSTARQIELVFDSEATGIRSMDNGQLIMDNWYDLNGRKLNSAPTRKGVYIKNGQKVVK